MHSRICEHLKPDVSVENYVGVVLYHPRKTRRMRCGRLHISVLLKKQKRIGAN